MQANEEGELADKALTLKEVRARQGELSKMRSLLFYEQQKRRRINKIKSKAYRRIRKRQDRRKADAEGTELEDDPEKQREMEEREAEARMEERMTLRHKNTSKWARSALKRGANLDSHTRKQVQEQLRLGQELRDAMDRPGGGDAEEEGSDGGDDDSGSEDEDAGEGEEDGASGGGRNRKAISEAKSLLAGIEKDTAEAEDQEAGPALHQMKFMQKAAQKQRDRARAEAEDLLAELEAGEDGEEGLDFESSDEEGGEGGGDSSNDEGGRGGEGDKGEEEGEKGSANGAKAPRMVEGSLETSRLSQPKKRLRVDGAITIDLDGVENSVPGAVAEEDQEDDDEKEVEAEVGAHAIPAANPWLQQNSRSGAGKAATASSGVVDVEAAAARALGEKGGAKGKQAKQGKGAAKASGGGDDGDGWSTPGPKGKGGIRKRKSGGGQGGEGKGEGEGESKGGDEDEAHQVKKQRTGRGGSHESSEPSQEELVRRAFAVPDATEEFNAEKEFEETGGKPAKVNFESVRVGSSWFKNNFAEARDQNSCTNYHPTPLPPVNPHLTTTRIRMSPPWPLRAGVVGQVWGPRRPAYRV